MYTQNSNATNVHLSYFDENPSYIIVYASTWIDEVVNSDIPLIATMFLVKQETTSSLTGDELGFRIRG